MALSNRDRIHQALDLLGPALNAYLTETVGSELPEDFDGGWIDILRAVKSTGPGANKDFNPEDPYDSLRMITDNVPYRYRRGWDPIKTRLTRADIGLATELLEVRNDFAHAASFTSDDAQRALDTASRLLLAIGAPREAEKVAKSRDDLRRVTYDRVDSNTARHNPKLNIGSDRLPPWREVLAPHPDVQNDQFNAAEFAADLYTVAMRSGGHKSEYTDAREFFARTYLTEGLRDLIGRNVARMNGDANASPVINLQTNFGGGKTHSMLALWHLTSDHASTDFGDEVGELTAPLDDVKKSVGIRRVALVGNQMEPANVDHSDGRPGIRTMWGELAWQLGGQDAYDIIATADQASTNPGASLRELFELYSPAVILIDEWVAYARQLVNASGLPAGDFDTQFTFAQTLTEAARATAGIQVVISIPASNNPSDADEVNEEEVGGEHGRVALARLKNVVGRTADQWQPANAQESFEIVRRRIFSVPDAAAMSEISVIAKSLVEYYRKHHSEFPSEAHEPGYIDRIKQCYPIHPELFDRLYQDWSTLDRFQRTRGVLQMMNRVVGTLWRDQDPAALVMPGTVPLSDADVVSEVAKYLEDNFKPILNSDVAGQDSVPYRVDHDHQLFGQRGTAQRLARTVFMDATPGLHTPHKGAEKKRIFLGTALPGDVPGNFHSALDKLANESTYLYTDGGRYWYDTQANTTRAARDHAAELPEADVWADVQRRLEALRRSTGDHVFTGYHLCPNGSEDVPDDPATRLVVVPMNHAHSARGGTDTAARKWVRDVLERRGSANRIFKNSLVFLSADEKRAAELDSAVRDYLAWTWVVENEESLGLGGQQANQAKARRGEADQIAESRLLETFVWGIYPVQPLGDRTFSLEVTSTGGADNDLLLRTSTRLKEEIKQARSSSLIRMDLDGPLSEAWKDGHIEVGQLYRYYATYPYLSRLRDRDVLIDGLYSVKDDLIGWLQDGFAFAETWDAESERYRGIHLPSHQGTLHISDATLIVKPKVAEEQYEKESGEVGGGSDEECESSGSGGTKHRTDTGSDGGASGGSGGTTTPPPPVPDPNRRYFGSVVLDSDLPARDFAEIHQELLRHLAKPGVHVDIRLEISATAPDGFDTGTQRTISENAANLHFTESGFVED
ncbi:DUF499 domain-containing protein [Gordonia alkaliphila]|uniref:Swt1 family HEPN domain-containing protein n=1 Tax=Gordonia alkaliphila TaxID=1053547 RepID=A0ABP8YWR0_9ACTN